MTRLLLIDAGLIFRAFFALPPMQDTAGRPVNAVYGFLAMTFREIEAIKPSHIAVAFDVPVEENHRSHLFQGYKANRPECPADLAPQFDLLRDVLRTLRIHVLEAPSYEADDIIGTMAHRVEAGGGEASILTGDRDALQLLTANTQVRYVRKLNEADTYDVPRFATEWGLMPLQLIDLKGLAGDSSDCIPGIRGIGEKTATKLLQEYRTLEAVLENAHLQKGKLRERLEEGREIALLSKQLATINTAVPGLPEPSDLLYSLDREAGRAKFVELRFRSLMSRVS